jgi:hypothetical protein
MDFDKIKTQLLEWMQSFVEQPTPALGTWAPCPYARAARLNNRIYIIDSTIANLPATVNQSLTLLEQYEVVVICFDHAEISGIDCQTLTSSLNKQLMKDDVVILEDHPELVEHVAGIQMNFGYCGLYVIQQLSKLNEAADKLKEKGYYNTWNQSEIDEVVTWRHQ